jgi:cation diffusion facilitator CzcD-associated flavoprotein CzcO
VQTQQKREYNFQLQMEESFLEKLRMFSSLLVTYVVILLTVISGFIGHFFYWLIFDVITRDSQRANRKLNASKNKKNDEYYALIIGSGFSGLGMAIKLKELGMDDYIIIERLGHVGGTWYANKYPGCACDVPSNLYSFSFEPNPKWSHFFSRQPEIGEYLEHCTDKYDIRRHVQFNTTVTQLKWLDDRQVWQITTQSNEQEKQFYARFVMAGYGPLSNASYPSDIPGIDKFEGQMCHTAEWDKTIDFKNKRVAVIGTGASAIQTVPEIQKAGVTKLYVFQRTPPWVIPRFDRVVTNWEKRLLTQFPIIQKFIRGLMYWIREATALSFAYRWPIRHAYQAVVKYNLDRQVEDKDLRKKLTPTFDLGCKRVLITNDWYPAIQQPNVQIVTNRIQEIKPNSIVTHDGDEYPIDILIWSTGYQVQKFALPVFGVNGRSLAEQWSESLQVILLW